jgi:hypothetical protein
MWSRKIAQLAIPRNRSSRRSRPFSGSIALIFMAPLRCHAFLKKVEPKPGTFTARSPEIVTAQHNDYTGLEK